MSNTDIESPEARSTSPSKRKLDDEGEKRSPKRFKLTQAEKLMGARELAPRPPNLEVKQVTPTPSQPKTKASTNNKRSSSLNLKNYPSNHHPAGVAIWILQKVEQARRELEIRRSTNHNSDAPIATSSGQYLAINSPSGSAGPQQWQVPSFSSYDNVPPAQEQEAGRLQAQRNRKTKQRQENWAKNKETDVVARAKIEAKKHFDAFPNATDAEQQVWIEEKVRLDFGRLLDRLAAQLNSELVSIPPYQIGFADYFFNKAANPRLADIDDEIVYAARLIAYVLPALTESVVNPRHQYAADTLVYALGQNAPTQEAFFAAVHMLAQDYQILSGLDKVMGNLFLPKTGPQLARKRASNVHEQSGSSNGLNAFSSTPAGAPIWHWKEPATIANSTRYTSPSTRAPPVNGAAPNTVVQPYYQDPLPPPIVVQAEVFRPPPSLPPQGYYQYSYMPNQPQNHNAVDYYPEAVPNFAPFSGGSSLVDYNSKRYQANSSAPLPLQPYAVTYPGPASESASETMSQANSVAANGNGIASEAHLPSRSPGAPSLPVSNQFTANSTSHQASSSATPIIMPRTEEEVQPDSSSHLPSQTSVEPGAEEKTRSLSPAEVVITSEPAIHESSRRKSSRGTVLTSKAKAAGIRLGTRLDDSEHTTSSKLSTTPKAPRSTKSPDELSARSPSIGIYESGITKIAQPEGSKPESSNGVVHDTPDAVANSTSDFVPRSSGRERKPTAKILASTVVRSGTKFSDYPSSVPRVSSKLRLSLSSQGSILSENSVSSVGTAGVKASLSPSDNSRTSLEEIQAVSEPKASTIRRQTDTLKQVVSNKQSNRLVVAPQVDCGSLKTAQTSTKKNQKFLTNDKGQSMNQALLLMARVAAEWSDSDEEDESTSEHNFQAKLQEAVDMQTQKSKSVMNARTHGPLSRPLYSPQFRPVTGVLSTTPVASHDLRIGRHQFDSGSIPLHTTGASHRITPIHHLPVLLPGHSPSNGVTPFHVDPRSSAQITDDWIRIVQLKDEARSRGLLINDSMNIDQLTNLLQAHDAGNLNRASKPGMRTGTPSSARLASLSRAPAYQNSASVGYHNGHSPGIPPSQFYPPTQSPGQSISSSSSLPHQPFPKHIQYFSSNFHQSDRNQAVLTPDQQARLQSIVSVTSDTSGESRSRRSKAQLSSPYDINPQGLTGGHPSGGTIINGLETRVVQAQQRQQSKGPEEASANVTNSSTPSTREGKSATPQPRMQTPPTANFKKGGIVLSFGKKAKRAATTTPREA